MKRFVFALVVFVNTLVWAGVSVVDVSNGQADELWLRVWDAVTWWALVLALLLGVGAKLTVTKTDTEVE